VRAWWRSALSLLAFILLLLPFTGCQVVKPAATAPAYTPSIQSTSASAPTITGSASQTSVLDKLPGATSTPVSIASPTPSTATPISPTPYSPGSITAENATSLQPILQRKFSPWDQVLKIVWSPEGNSLAVSAGEKIHILDSNDLDDRLEIEMDSWAPGLAYAPGGHSLAATDRDGVLRIWDVATGELIQTIQAHQKSASGVAYSPDGSLLATAGYDAMARLWALPSGEKRGEMIGGSFAVPAIAFTPDGARLAIVNGNIIRLRDVGSQRFVKTIAAENPLFTISFSPDGRTLASGDVANTIQLWDMTNEVNPAVEIRQSVYTLIAQEGPVSGPKALVWQVAFSPDGTLLAAASGDGMIRIWDVESGLLAATLAGHSKAATSLAFSPDGRWLASGGLDGKVVLWGVKP